MKTVNADLEELRSDFVGSFDDANRLVKPRTIQRRDVSSYSPPPASIRHDGNLLKVEKLLLSGAATLAALKTA